ncbi:MAG: DMT family transporter [Pseudomonadota bacterium]
MVLWSTGYIGSKAGAPFAEPFTFLSIRFGLVAALLALAWPWLRPDRISARDWVIAGSTGALVHGIYLGAVFWAIDAGLPAGVAAVIVCLQPLLTAVMSGLFLGERVPFRSWLGLIAGLGGTVLVVIENTMSGIAGFSPLALLVCAVSLFAITAGTLLQKAYATQIDFRAALLPQYLGALAVTAAAALTLETGDVTWSPTFIFALAWLVLVLSIGAISLLFIMIEQNAVWRTAALFYLVPATTALMGWVLFGETLSPLQLMGLVIVSGAVLVARSTSADTSGNRSGETRTVR